VGKVREVLGKFQKFEVGLQWKACFGSRRGS